MFTLFTGSDFGRGISSNASVKADLTSYLAAYRRKRAQLARQLPLAQAA